MQFQPRMWRNICIRGIQRPLSTLFLPRYPRDTIKKKVIEVNWLAIKLLSPGKGIEERKEKKKGKNNDLNIHSAVPNIEEYWPGIRLFTPVNEKQETKNAKNAKNAKERK